MKEVSDMPITAHNSLSHSCMCSKAVSDSVHRMLEEHTYFCFVYMLWQRDDVWQDYQKAILGDVPAVIRPIIRKGILKSLHGQVSCCVFCNCGALQPLCDLKCSKAVNPLRGQDLRSQRDCSSWSVERSPNEQLTFVSGCT